MSTSISEYTTTHRIADMHADERLRERLLAYDWRSPALTAPSPTPQCGPTPGPRR